MLKKKIFWVQIQDDWADGWYPIITKEEKENIDSTK